MCSRCSAKVAYAETVIKNGFYLGILDIALLARAREKDILLVYFDDDFEDAPGVSTLFEVLAKLVPGSVMPPVEKAIDPASSSTWTVASVNASFRRGSFQQLNHFLPLFNKEAMGDNAWDTIALQNKDKLKKRIQHSISALPPDDDPEDEFSESIREQVHVLERQLAFMDMMHRLSFHPGMVPADGNCALWTLLALDGGAFAKAQWSSNQHVQQLRLESCIYYRCQVFVTTFFKTYWGCATKCMPSPSQ